MGHLIGKDVYRNIGKGIDKLHVRAPWNDELYAVLKELYTTEEAELIVKMPMVFSGIDRISRITKMPLSKLQKILNRLSSKGLVMGRDACISECAPKFSGQLASKSKAR